MRRTPLRTIAGLETGLQGYLAYMSPPPPQDRHKTISISLLQGPRRWRFLMSVVPLYHRILGGRASFQTRQPCMGLQG